MSRLLAVAFILFCFEVGLFLVIVPWSDLWANNFLLSYVAGLKPIVLSSVFRGAVTGLGAVDILLGISELKLFLQSFKTPKRTMS
jgi:hypothetical protein